MARKRTPRIRYDSGFKDCFRLVDRPDPAVESVRESARNVMKGCYKNPSDIMAFVESQGTPVYVIKESITTSVIFLVLGYEPGFIPPTDSKRFRVLTKLLESQGEKPGCSFENGVFVLVRSLNSVSFLAHQLHHWLAFQSSLPGYNEDNLVQYRKFWTKNQGKVGPEINKMSREELVSLKDAIRRDMDALSFLHQLHEEILTPARQAADLSNGDTFV